MEGKKTKDKTRVLAHSRRQRENDTFTGIAEALPIQENTKDLDKASVLRVAIHFLKLRDVVAEGDHEAQELGEEEEIAENGPSISNFLPNFSKDVLQALDGFLMVVSRDGRILYVSESIANYLGLRQVDVIGVHVQDIIHPQDCSEVSAIFQTQGHDTDHVFDAKDPLRRKFVIRMRCAFTPSVRSITRCSNFKPIYCSAFLKFGKSGPKRGQFLGIVALCKLASIPKIKEMCVGTSFKTKHALDLGYIGIDTRIRWILGYDPSEMMGVKAYQYFHPDDLNATTSCHMNLLSRGVSHSPCYRFMSRWGDWIWVRSKSLMLYNSINHLPEGIAIYTWIVRVEEEDERMLAIKEGKSGEDKLKKYDPFESSVVSAGGFLDVSKLVDPHVPSGMTLSRDQTSKSVDSSPISTPSPQVQPESKAQSPPIKQTTPTSHLVAPPSQPVHPVQQVSHSPGRQPPPPLVSQPVPIPGSMTPLQQLGGRYPTTTSPPLSVCSPPDSTVDDFPPNVNPFVTHGTMNMDGYSPDRHSVIRGTSPADLVNNHHAQQSFIPSPPYTPYPSPTKHTPFEHTAPTPYANYPTPYSSGHPSPVRSIRQSLSPSETSADGQFGSPPSHTSPPYSSAAASSPYQEEIYITSEATQFTSPCGDGVQTALPIMESLLAPSALGYQNTNSTDMQFPNLQATGSCVPVIGQPSVPPRQTVIEGSYVDEARRRYNKVASGLPMGHTNQLRNDREGSESISQWSQWLKGGAPAPVC